MPAEPLLFIAGIPSSGKSHFANWLASERGYMHIEAERPHSMAKAGLQREWNEAINTTSCTAFVDELQRRDEPSVLNWGFPVKRLRVAAALKAAGFACWWFDADIPAARLAHAAAGKSTLAFDHQVSAIATAGASIAALFSPNVLQVLLSSGQRLSAQEIYTHIENADRTGAG